MFGDGASLMDLVPYDSEKGKLATELERVWGEFWDSCPDELREQCHAGDNKEILKRVFLTGFARGAKWQQGRPA